MTDYLKSGISMIWLVDPVGRCVTVYRPMAMPQLLEADEELNGEKALPGFRCKVAALFPVSKSSPDAKKRRDKGKRRNGK